MKFPVLNTTVVLLFSLLASVGSLALALVSEYGFGLKPCELCILQRIPYVVVIMLSLLGLWQRRWGFLLCIAVGLIFLVDSGIAAYHTGVEQHWIAGPEACTDAGDNRPMTMEEILAKIKGAPIVACDQPQWDFHGITMAALNAAWALTLAMAVFVALRKMRGREKGSA